MIESDSRVHGLNTVRAIILMVMVGLVAACSGGSSRTSDPSNVVLDPVPPPDPDPPPDPVPPPDPDPSPAPTVSLTAADNTVTSGASTTLSWTSQNATDCSASGGWSGNRNTAGSEVVGPISANTTYNLTCTGSGGNSLVMITVAINGSMQLSWLPPTENVDGSPLTNLAGFVVYWGTQSRNYTGNFNINSPATTEWDATVSPGPYYFSVTALDANGNESENSNEILKTIP